MIYNDRILIPSVRYEIWGWPAAVNLTLGGTAAGFYLFALISTEVFLQVGAVYPLFRYNLVSLLLVAAGFLTVGIEAGSPFRGKFLLYHLKKSWMSREVLAGLVLILFAAADWVHPLPVFKIVAAVSAAGLLVSQGFMVVRARAVTAWTNLWIPFHFVASGLALGFGFFLFWSAELAQTTVPAPTLLLGLVGLLSSLLFWSLIVRPKEDPVEDYAAVHLRETLSMTLSCGVGCTVPILLVIAAMIAAQAGGAGATARLLCLFTSICVLTGGSIQRTAIILQANTLRAVRPGRPYYHEPACPRP
jgi:DMSO reductase anchor subunit